MADDINKKISIDVQVNTDAQQQVEQYKSSFDSLRTSINNLGKPLSDLSKNIDSLNSDLAKLAASNEKIAAKMMDASKKASDQQAKNLAASNQKLKTSLSEAEAMKEQAWVKELQLKNSLYGEQALTESKQYTQQKRNLDEMLKSKSISQELYNKEAEQILKDHLDRILQITNQYIKDNPDLKANSVIKIDTPALSTPDFSKIETAQEKITAVTQQGDQTRSKSAISIAQTTLGKIFGLFVKTEAAKTTAATTAGAKTAATAESAATALQKAIGTKTLQTTQDIASSAYKIFTDGLQLQSQAKIKALEADKTKELNNASLNADQKLAIENKYKTKEAAVQLKAFKEKQKADIAQAIINGAVAITKVTAQSGVAAPIMIGAVIAETAAQIATITKQQPPAMAKGGYFKSDGKGAVLSGYSHTDDTNAFLRSGEAVVVSEAMRDPWARNLVSAINTAYGGRDFSVPNLSRGYAVGGIFTDGGSANRYYNQPVNDQKNLANTVAYQMINNFPPVYVDVKDINNQQNILAQTINRVTL